MIPMLFAATSVGVIAFIAAFHMTDAFVLRERSIAYGYSVASEVRSGGIQLAVLRSCSSRPAECIDGWREVPSGLVFYDYLGCQGREPDGWLALPKSGREKMLSPMDGSSQDEVAFAGEVIAGAVSNSRTSVAKRSVRSPWVSAWGQHQ